MSLPGTAPSLPAFLVCEDGHEYSERFTRLLGVRFSFLRAGDCAAARAICAGGPHGVSIEALLLDLDFRRTPSADLVDESGAVSASRPESERRRLAGLQGILILRALRAAGLTLPALLFADLDDPGQVAFLEASLAPLEVVPSSTALPAIAAKLAAFAGR
jgi:hypothetical protein